MIPRSPWLSWAPRGLAAIALLAFAFPSSLAAAPPAPIEVTFAGYNGTYSQPGASVPEATQGALTLRLSSPANRLVVAANRLRLEPLPDGTHRATWTVEFSGDGKLVADFELAGSPGRLEDEMVLPLQTRTVAGRVRVERAPAGFLFTPVELPASVEIDVRSRLASRIGDVCDTLALLPLAALGCAGIEGALTRVAIPLPAPGETYLVADEHVGPAERARLESYLSRR